MHRDPVMRNKSFSSSDGCKRAGDAASRGGRTGRQHEAHRRRRRMVGARHRAPTHTHFCEGHRCLVLTIHTAKDYTTCLRYISRSRIYFLQDRFHRVSTHILANPLNCSKLNYPDSDTHTNSNTRIHINHTYKSVE